jgi:hypothetical protein
LKLLEFLESPNTRKPRVQRAENCTYMYTHWVQHSSLGWGYRPSSALTLQTGSIHILRRASYEESIFKKATIHEFKLVELKEVELSCLKFTTANPIFSMDSITRVESIIKAVYEYGANRDILKKMF